MLPNHIVTIIKIFDCFGFFTEYKSHIFWKCFRYALSFLFLIYFSSFRYDILIYLPSIKITEFVNAYLQYFSALFTYHAIFFESFVIRRLQREFWHKKKKKYCQALIEWHSFLYKILCHISVLSVYVILLFVIFDLEQLTFAITVTVLVRVYQMRIAYYLVYMEVVRIHLKITHVYAKEASILLAAASNGFIRHIYQETSDMVFCMNQIFGYSQFVVVLYSFFLLLTDFNLYYVSFDEHAWIQKWSKLIMRPFDRKAFIYRKKHFFKWPEYFQI